ncbi:MAG TPA: hypothetical protein VER17_12400 [Tepidisphaeraceae bacterium]|nr:hypothetical protein [Tepidisphaeraceae bacterium]
MPWWFKSFLVVLGGLVLLLLGDVASRAGFNDAAACRLAGAALIGLGIYLALATAFAPGKKKRGTR